MSEAGPINSSSPGVQNVFTGRHKLLSNREEIVQIANRICQLLEAGQTAELDRLLDQYFPPDIADMVNFLDEKQSQAVFRSLDTAEQAEVLDEVDDATKSRFLKELKPEQAAKILDRLHSDEGADILGVLSPAERQPILEQVEKEKAERIRELLSYPCDTAGGIMSTGYIAVQDIVKTRISGSF